MSQRPLPGVLGGYVLHRVGRRRAFAPEKM
jgi:hypothetical protein